MNLSNALPENELLLAQLTAAKLAKVMHGFISVGTSSLELASPTDFLTGRDQTPLGFLEVLRCIAVKPGYVDKIGLFRERVDELSSLTRAFHSLFMELAHWRKMSPHDIQTVVNQIGDCYTQFCQRLGDFCSLLGMDSDYAKQAQQDRSYLDACIRTIGALGPPSPIS